MALPRPAPLAVLLLALLPPPARGQSILTVAGGGTDDGRPATAAGLGNASGVTVDAAGNILIADTDNNRIRRVDSVTGIITTCAGNGSTGYAGDGGPATEAGLHKPSRVALDGQGRLLVTEFGNHRLRRVDIRTGVITTIAGNGTTTDSGDGGPASAAGLPYPTGLAVDGSGNIFVAEYYSGRVRRIDARAGIITTVAAGSLGWTPDIALDSGGNLLIVHLHIVSRVDAATGAVTTVAGSVSGFGGDGGPATAALLRQPEGIVVDGAGNVLISDSYNSRVRRVDGATGLITTIAGGGSSWNEGIPATEAIVGGPKGLAVDASGNLLVAEAGNSRIRRVDARTGIITTVAGNRLGFFGDGGPATAAALRTPTSVAVDFARNIYVADTADNRIRKVDATTGVMTTIASATTVSGLYEPLAVAVDGAGNLFFAGCKWSYRVWRRDAGTGTITVVAGTGEYGYSGDGGPATAAKLFCPAGLALDRAGNLFIADRDNSSVRRVDSATGVISTFAGTGKPGFSGDGGPATAAMLDWPSAVAVDSRGNVFISDRDNHRIRRVDGGAGIITTVAGTGSRGFGGEGGPASAAMLASPFGIAVDRADDLFIADRENHRIRRVDAATGVITSIAGSGRAGYSGDGGPATAAGLAFPDGLTVDGSGNIFIADTGSNRVRAVFECVTVGPPSLASPAEGATGISTGPTLWWSKVAGAFRYDVYLGTSDPPASAVATDLDATSFTPLNLTAGAKYYWRVVAKGDPFCVPPSSAGSPVRTFTTKPGCAPPSAPALVAPADGATGVASPVTLSWNPALGAGSYDVFLGATNPPPLAASGLTSTTHTASGLVGSGLYYWSVLAHAACDPAKTASSPVRSFGVTGVGCPPPGAFSLTTPADGATGVSPDVTLTWSASPGATNYDLYLGLTSSPPLYLSGLTSASVSLKGLLTGSTYRWKVVAWTSCAPGAVSQTAVRSFTVRGACSTPGGTSLTFLPPGNVGTGQTYVVAWSAATDLDTGGGYAVERSTSASFSPIVDTVTTTSLFASFVAPGSGSLHHRVRAVPACDPARAGPWSPTGAVTVVSAKPNVVFSRAPEALLVGLGEILDVKKTAFAIENVTSSPLQVIVSRQELQSVPFFTIADPAGGDAAFVTLEPRVPKLLEVRYSGPPNDVPGAYQGLIVVASTGAGLAVTPYAFVSLKVGSSPDAVPQFRVSGVTTEYAAFPGLTGDDSSRPPLTVDVHNPGSSPLELAAEVGPEVWLSLEPGWNATPIPPGATRTLRLSTRRIRAPNGSALPRYTYLTLRTKGGTTSRLLVQDNEAPLLSSGRGASAVRPEASFLVPSVAHVTSALVNTFVSRLSLSNAGTEAVQAELVFTPASSDTSLVDGFGAATKRATVLVPPNDVVRLSDPLVLLFGLTPPVSGTLEVRASEARAGFLSVSSSVDAPSPKGGTFGFALPVFRSGEGIRAGSSAAITAVASDAAERTNLILAETTGVDTVQARVSLFDSGGSLRGSETVTVPRWGQRQLSGVVARLGGAAGSRAGRLEVTVESGGGTLAAVTTVVDNVNDDAATFVAQRAPDSAATALTLRPAWALATGTVKSLVPALVNGFQTFPSSAAPFTFRSVMGFTSLSTADALFRLTYYDLASGATIPREVRVPGRKSVEYTNVLEQLFGIAPGARSQGPLFVESDPNGLLWCRVASSLDSGTIGDSFPVVPIPSEGLTGGGVARVIAIDGLEQSVDRTRGTRSNLLLNEVAGKPTTVLVSLYEAGNRSSPIAERAVSLKPLEKVQLSTVFSELGLESEARRKDRTNVLCTVRALSGDGLASAVVTTIDNRTGDTRNVALAPNGTGAGGVTIGF
jgi:sugar lactone lactonase YvrE